MRIRIALIVAVIAVGCAAPQAKLTDEHRRAIADSVQAMLMAWRDAFNARDFARASSFYSNDPEFRWFENGELKFRSGREIGDTMKAEAGGIRAMALSLIAPEVAALAPGVAAVSLNFAEKVTDSDGKTVGFAGALTSTVIHGDSGWTFLVGHVSLASPVVDSAAKPKPPRS